MPRQMKAKDGGKSQRAPELDLDDEARVESAAASRFFNRELS